MRVLVVGDNRGFKNWGARAASSALLMLLKGHVDSIETVSGLEFLLDSASVGIINTIMPRRFEPLYSHMRANRSRRRLYDYYLRLEETLGATDFVVHDPAQTARNIERFAHKYPELAKLREAIEGSDVIVIHGEGDFVFSTPERRQVLYMLGIADLAIAKQKSVVFANGMLSACPRTGLNEATVSHTAQLFRQFKGVYVRDHLSLEFSRSNLPGVNAELVPDSLFSIYRRAQYTTPWVPPDGAMILPYPSCAEDILECDLSGDYVCVAGGALAAKRREQAREAYTLLVEKLNRVGIRTVLTETCEGDRFLRQVATDTRSALVPVEVAVLMGAGILGKAKAFVTGRYHPAILASLNGTPGVYLSSLGHKMQGLDRLLESPKREEYPSIPSAHDVERIVDATREVIDAGQSERERIRATSARISLLSQSIAHKIVGVVSQAGGNEQRNAEYESR